MKALLQQLTRASFSILFLTTQSSAMDMQRQKRICAIATYELENGSGQHAIRNLKPIEAIYPPAKNLLGMCYEYGKDVEQNLNYATHLYEEAAKKGVVSALFNLGNCYEYGRGVTQDYVKARQLYQATLGLCPIAYFRLARLYMEGLGTERDVKLGFSLYEQAADAGYKDALFDLGRCYELGCGITVDFNKASDYYRKYIEKTDHKYTCKICNKPILDQSQDKLLFSCPKRHLFHESCFIHWMLTYLSSKPGKPICPAATCGEILAN